MPTLGPSVLFAAGLALGVGTGVLIPRRAKPETFTPPPPPSGEKRDTGPLSTPTGNVVLQGGFPGPIPDVIKRIAYTAAYDRRMRHPAWTAEHLTAQSLARAPPNASPVPLESARAADTAPVVKGDRSKSTFMEDAGVPELFRAKLQDYFRSGYDRGHMVPAADAKISQQAMNETFYLSNIAPQVGDGFNRHYWAYLEDFCRRLTTNFEDVYVFTVPLYLPTLQPDGKWRVTYEVIGSPPSISVPTHFAKVILASRPDFSYPQKPSSDKTITSNSTVKELAMGAFILPNKEIPDQADLRGFIAPVEAVEKAAGLQLFNPELKQKSKQLCAVTQCQVIVRRFDDARKNTSLLSLGGIFIDPSSSHSTDLADATQARTRLLNALKGQPVGVVDAVLAYLPYISGIITCLDNDELLWKSDPAFQWRPSLTHYISPPSLALPSIHAEHLFVLLTYILGLNNYAQSILATIPTPSHVSSEEEKRITAGLARAVDLFCQAAGIAEWTAENVCPQVESVRSASGRLGRYRWPIETGAEAFRGLAITLLADAHVTAIRKLLLPVLPHTLFAPPGPPLPPNHPSPSLLAKLYLHVASLYTSAMGLLQSHQGRKGGDVAEGVEGEIIPELERYLRKESRLAHALAHKWIGVEAGENGKGAKVGEAVSWVKEAQTRLQEMEDGKVREKMKGLSFGKGSEKKKEERKARQGRVERELEDVKAWVRAYSRMNDTVAFQPVPPISSLTVPAGRPIFASKPFKPPLSKMVRVTDEPTSDEYAGKGNYF